VCRPARHARSASSRWRGLVKSFVQQLRRAIDAALQTRERIEDIPGTAEFSCDFILTAAEEARVVRPRDGKAPWNDLKRLKAWSDWIDRAVGALKKGEMLGKMEEDRYFRKIDPSVRSREMTNEMLPIILSHLTPLPG
jgi:hypothetical protein